MTEQEQRTEITGTATETLEPTAVYDNQIYALVDDMKDDSQFKGLSDEELKAFILERANIYADNFEKRHGESEYPQAIINTVKDILNASDYR